MTPKEIAEAYNALLDEYSLAKAEATAQGLEFPHFDEWCGAVNPKEEAQKRWLKAWEDDTLDLY
jgi:hypothetical protein